MMLRELKSNRRAAESPQDEATDLLRQIWAAWLEPGADGDDVFAVFGERIKAVLAG